MLPYALLGLTGKATSDVDDEIDEAHPDDLAEEWVEEFVADRPPRWVPILIVTLILAMIAANNVGNTLFLNWSTDGPGGGYVKNPLVVLALNSTNRVLLTLGWQVDWVPFLIIPMLRLLAPDPLFYLLGRLYRENTRRFAKALYPGADRLFVMFEGEHEPVNARILEALVLIAPNNPICLLAGFAAMPVRKFIILNVVGTLGRIVLMKWISIQFTSQVQDLVALLAKYQGWLLKITIAVLVISLVLNFKKILGAAEEL